MANKNVAFFIENTEFQEKIGSYLAKDNKLAKNQESLYAKAFETYVGQIFGSIQPRASSSDTRPDIPLTVADLDKLVPPGEDYSNRDTIISFISALRQNIASVESASFEEVQKAFNDAAAKEKDPVRRAALLQTIGGIEVKGSFGVDLLGSSNDSLSIQRKTPRGLTGRQINLKSLLGGILPEGSSLVIPLVSGVQTKDIRSAKQTVRNFFNRAKDNLHSAITGEYSGNDAAINYFKNSAAAKQMRAKGQNLWMQYIVRSGGIVKSYSAYLPESFKVENTKLEINSSSLYVAYTTAFESRILARLQQALKSKTQDSVDKIIKDSDLKGLLQVPPNPNVNTQIIVPSGGSIPIGNAKYPSSYVPRISKSAFNSRIGIIRDLLRETRQKLSSIGDFITDDTITALTKREMLRRMPVGPIGGPPKSSRVLTYRTGRFVDSVQVIANINNKQIQYYYSPNYWIHEATSRNPRNLIDSSINSVTRSLFGKRFNLVKANQSL